MKKFILMIIGVALIASACKQNDFDKQQSQDHLIMSVLWYQKSAEMKALYYQSFNWAKLRVETDIDKNPSDKPKAVIVDIDETMLDNSPFEANCIQTGVGYTSETWKNWTSMMNAKALPGAVEFSHYAQSLGVEVFYISNRSVDEFDETLKNLQNENFAYADSTHLILKTTTSSKTERRNIVKENYEIILLIGDNLGDFSEIFEDRSSNFGFKAVEENKELFGDRFIVLPNPMYGNWESPILDYRKDLSDKEKYELRKSKLIGY
jgi:5'-nucleotidase (lipoprotein e(P4) family)